MRLVLVPLAFAALLAEGAFAFMPSFAPGLRARSPALSSRARTGALPRLDSQLGGRSLFMAYDFSVGVLGDLHLDPRKMEDYETGKKQWMPILNSAKAVHGNVAMVSLGDLGESKSVRPDETDELFAGTTECHRLAASYLGSFEVPYEVIGGNHDLEGLDEFDTDEANLEMFLRLTSAVWGLLRPGCRSDSRGRAGGSALATAVACLIAGPSSSLTPRLCGAGSTTSPTRSSCARSRIRRCWLGSARLSSGPPSTPRTR
jgi:hypothetical protein